MLAEPDDFSDFTPAGGAAASPAEVAAQPVQDIDQPTFNATIGSMVRAGASPAELTDYAAKHGYTLGGDVAEATQAAHAKLPFGVVSRGDQTHAQENRQPAEDFSDFAQAPAEPRTGLAHDAAVLGHGVLKGLGTLADMVTPGKAAADAITGQPGTADAVDAASQGFDLGQAETPGQRVLQAAGEGAGMAGPLGAEAVIPAAVTALSGAVSGAAGQGAKEEGYGPLTQFGAALVAGLPINAAASGVKAAVSALGPRELSDLGQSFARQDVRMMPAMTGRAGPQMATGVTHMTLGGLALSDAAELSIASAKAARERIAGNIGSVADATGAGQAAQRGAKAFMATTQDRGSKLYEAIPIAHDRPAILNNTRNALNDLNSGLASNPELSALLGDSRLGAYQKALTPQKVWVDRVLQGGGKAQPVQVEKGGTLSWQDLKAFRTYVGEMAGRPTLQDSTAKDALQRLYAGLSADMEATAAADGPKSLTAFQRANTYWRARQARIDNVLTSVLGKDQQKGGQAAFNQIESWAGNKGEAIKLAQMLRSLPEDEAATVRASVFNRLGQATPGRGGSEIFSPAEFATQWQKLSQRAKASLFPGIDYRSDIDDMVRIADAMKDAHKYANTSRTSLGTNALALLGAFFSNPLYAVGMGGAELGAGKLLSSQRFARWLASAPKKPNGAAALAHINRLSAIASAEPAIANNVLYLQEKLAAAFAQPPLKAAAGPEHRTEGTR